MKVYNKRGRHNFMERDLGDRLVAYFEKNPEEYKEYDIPSNYDDLKAADHHYCTEDAQVIEETPNQENVSSTANSIDASEEEEESTEENSSEVSVSSADDTIPDSPDPINRDSPIIRDYVKEDEFSRDGISDQQSASSTYDEPSTFKESFDMPDAPAEEEKPEKASEPLNTRPQAPLTTENADPQAKAKRKSKKQFTKYAVEAGCALLSRGLVWYGTKDIAKDQIKSLVDNDEINAEALKMIVWLDSETEGSISKFFEQAIGKTQAISKFSDEEKAELVIALDDWLTYQNIEINPTVNLGTIVLGMVFTRALQVMEIKAQSSSILTQLKDMHQGTLTPHETQAPPVPEENVPENTEETSTTPEEDESQEADLTAEPEPLKIGEEQATKE